MISPQIMPYQIKQVETDNEWQEFHRIRKTEIFDAIDAIVYDPNHFTLSHPDHKHFVLLVNDHIRGVASIEILTPDEIALRPFAIDGDHKNHGYGTAFLTLLEAMVLQEGCTLIRLHANPDAVNFYKRNGYREMPFNNDFSLNPDCIDMGKPLPEAEDAA